MSVARSRSLIVLAIFMLLTACGPDESQSEFDIGGATGDAGDMQAVPDATDSYPIDKLEGTHFSGSGMPKNGSLSSSQIDMIRAWIDDGAKNN